MDLDKKLAEMTSTINNFMNAYETSTPEPVVEPRKTQTTVPLKHKTSVITEKSVPISQRSAVS